MAIHLLDLELWSDKLKNECPVFLGRAFETLEDDNAALEFYDSPLALVYLSSDDSNPNSTANRITQLHNSIIVVKIALRKITNKNDRLSTESSHLFRSCRLEVFNALLGWTPDDCEKPLEHVSGNLTTKGDWLFWLDKFTTNDYLRR